MFISSLKLYSHINQDERDRCETIKRSCFISDSPVFPPSLLPLSLVWPLLLSHFSNKGSWVHEINKVTHPLWFPPPQPKHYLFNHRISISPLEMQPIPQPSWCWHRLLGSEKREGRSNAALSCKHERHSAVRLKWRMILTPCFLGCRECVVAPPVHCNQLTSTWWPGCQSPLDWFLVE